MTTKRRPASFAAPRGFGAVAAIVVLVLLAAIAAAVVRLSTSSQTGAARQLTSARAAQAAQAGIEWGLYQALRSSSCAATTTLDLAADLGMRVTVGCSAATFNEGLDAAGTAPNVVKVYTIDAVACNGPAACPDAARAVTANYVERRRLVTATDQ